LQQQHVHFYPPVSVIKSNAARPLHSPHTSVTPTPHKKLKLDHATGSESSHHSHHHHTVVVATIPAPMQTVSFMPEAPPSTGSKYNRKQKSLGILADSFLKQLTTPTATTSPLNDFCQEIVIDQIANDLAVERRRVYDVVNILEALQVVVKMGKNTYHWMGREHLSRQFALLQHEGMEHWPELAVKSGLLDQVPPVVEPRRSVLHEPSKETNKSLTRLSQLFLQVFLVGVDHVSLPEASDLIHGGRSTPEELVALGMQEGDEYPTDARKLQKVAARGLKTKIRRLYDIANVFLSVGLLRKSENRYAATAEGKRPQYQWNYGLDIVKSRQVYYSMPDQMKQKMSPFNDLQEAILVKSTVNNPNYSGILTFSEPLGCQSDSKESPNSNSSSLNDITSPTTLSSSTPPLHHPPESHHHSNASGSISSSGGGSDIDPEHGIDSIHCSGPSTQSRLLRDIMEGGSLLSEAPSSPARRVSLSNETTSCLNGQ
jgi:E2F/DP family winged-helix DNA-binding domain